ncbi:GNAT family N-acetyltransferase [Pseudonocardia sp.]|uniref:GNAT family N-acetyltransferase n=1 Tax=Pseudonocardia sp. TaxID=60912 RepID=UPI003D1206D3
MSIFVRDRLGSPTLAGGNPRSTVLLHDPRKPRQVRATTTNNVRRNIDLGFTTSTTVGPDLDEDALAQFTSCYRETMTRVAAATRNLYDADYLRACLSFPRSWLVATHAPGGGFAAGMLLVRSDDTLHYYLGGTTDAHLDRSPVRNAFLAAMDLADSLGLPLNFGGGIHPGDGLEKFKRGFSNAEATFTTHEIVADVKAYARLSGEEPNAAFFPAYRAPA